MVLGDTPRPPACRRPTPKPVTRYLVTPHASSYELYPVPAPATRRPWLIAMEWRDLLFAHWPVPPELLRGLIPSRLTLETWDGAAWLGVVPFRMNGVRPRLAPAVGPLSDFAELNVRTYVGDGQRSGVWFFSLDAASPAAVRLARGLFQLPSTLACVVQRKVTVSATPASARIAERPRHACASTTVRQARHTDRIPGRSSTGSPSVTACSPPTAAAGCFAAMWCQAVAATACRGGVGRQ